ncbi:MAG: putative hydrolase of the superfamily [Actinomycetota bacterium]|nr:putative hydrolase of the superfamily [Actinomycetota bacterium]
MKRLDEIRAVTYDCWGTLLRDRDWKGATDLRVSALRRFLDLDETGARDLLDEAWRKHDEAWKQIETFGAGRMAAYCLEARGVSDDDTIKALTKEFEEASLQGGVEAVDGSREILETLRGRNIRLGLVCDTGFSTGRVVRQLLTDAGLIDYLEVLCFSDEVGVPKPGNEIFAKALAELGARPPEAIHVGDLKRTDIAGAHDVGMHTVRFKGVHDDQSDAREADCVISRHEQILDCLNE